jgi:hypothetical protein
MRMLQLSCCFSRPDTRLHVAGLLQGLQKKAAAAAAAAPKAEDAERPGATEEKEPLVNGRAAAPPAPGKATS